MRKTGSPVTAPTTTPRLPNGSTANCSCPQCTTPPPLRSDLVAQLVALAIQYFDGCTPLGWELLQFTTHVIADHQANRSVTTLDEFRKHYYAWDSPCHLHKTCAHNNYQCPLQQLVYPSDSLPTPTPLYTDN